MNVFLAVAYIFALRLIDQTLGTLRALYVNKGRPGIGAMLGFIESAIWVIAISQVIKDLRTNGIDAVPCVPGFLR